MNYNELQSLTRRFWGKDEGGRMKEEMGVEIWCGFLLKTNN